MVGLTQIIQGHGSLEVNAFQKQSKDISKEIAMW